MSIADSLSSMSSTLTAAATMPDPAPFQTPDTDIEQYEAEKGPSAVSLMMAEIEAVWHNVDPELGAPVCQPMSVPALDLQPITDLLNGSIIIEGLPEMPDIQLEIPQVLADALNAATAAYAEVSGALAAAMPMIGALPGMIAQLEQMPAMIMGEVGAQLGAAIGETLDAVGLLNPIMSAVQIGTQVNQVYSALSMVANGQVSSPEMMGALGNALSKGAALSPQLAAAANTVLNQASAAAVALGPIAGAAAQVAASTAAIKSAVSNPSTMTPATVASATAQATNAVAYAVGSLTG